ncbi:MAG: PotD/PotF family extracellular solute-binding protein [Dongiaceae bacterium]
MSKTTPTGSELVLRAARTSRRGFLAGAAKTAVAGAAVIGAPMIVGVAPVHTAKAAFEGESLIAVSWSGNYETVFREQIIGPFNEQYGTKAETVGGWDQMVNQIKAAPEDNPPYDIIVAEEYVSSSGLAEKVYLETDKSKIPNLEAVYPWFYETRPAEAAKYGIPFGGGTTMLLINQSAGIEPDSWNLLWDERLAGKVTADSAAWWWTVSIPAVLNTAVPGLDEMYDWPTGAEPLFQKLETMKVAKWFKDGAEQANILNQEEALAAMSYSSDAYTFMLQNPDTYRVAVPSEGASGWTDWYFKIRGTKHSDLADLFLNYLLEKDTQDRFLANTLIFVARKDVAVPPQWGSNYPASNDDYYKKFQIITMDGWTQIGNNYTAMDDRMKQVVSKTTSAG